MLTRSQKQPTEDMATGVTPDNVLLSEQATVPVSFSVSQPPGHPTGLGTSSPRLLPPAVSTPIRYPGPGSLQYPGPGSLQYPGPTQFGPRVRVPSWTRMSGSGSPPPPSSTSFDTKAKYSYFKDLGISLGLAGKELADFVSESVSKEIDREENEKVRQHELSYQQIEADLARDKLNAEIKSEENRNQSKSVHDLERTLKEEMKLIHTKPASYKIKLDTLDGKGDVDAYLEHFERVANSSGWDRSTWALTLASLLREEAQKVYLRLAPEIASNYSSLKDALLSAFRCTPESFRLKFRSLRKCQSETFGQFAARLRASFLKWVAIAKFDPAKPQELIELILQEQMLSTLSPELTLFVLQNSPKTLDDIAQKAQAYTEARRTLKHEFPSRNNKSKDGKDNSKQAFVHSNSNMPKLKTVGSPHSCYNCGGKDGHIARNCPKAKKIHAMSSSLLSNPSDKCKHVSEDKVLNDMLCSRCQDLPFSPNITLRCNLKEVEGLRDTGADIIAVHQSLVLPCDMTSDTTNIRLADNKQILTLGTAVVHIDSPVLTGRVKVVVMSDPLYPVIIGNNADIELDDGTFERRSVPVYKVKSLAPVQTRAQRKKTCEPLKFESHPIYTDKDKLSSLQKSCDSLRRARRYAESEEKIKMGKNYVKFFWKKDVLYRKYFTDLSQTVQVCVPVECRAEVMHVAHDTPMAGHLGYKKTLDRIWGLFYWPGMCADIRRYCISCDRCQKVSPKGKVSKVPLEKMPLMDEPFRRIAVDLIGPISPPSDRGHRFILVVVDYATRYPEAVPLKNIDSETVAEALFEMWTRLGVPQEVLSDNGTQFVSAMMREVHRLLSVKGIHTSPYHAQANGLVERFNGTLKSMLRKLCIEQPREWDRFLPALLFAYREVPQSSTCYSPFELLFGRVVKGPMQILKTLWTNDSPNEEILTTCEYVLNLRNRIAETCEIARKNLEVAADEYKSFFDKKTVKRSFKANDKVLLLLPSKHNKLEMQWLGPYEVLEKLGPVDYKIKLENHKVKVYHANMLKRYIERSSVATMVLEEVDDRQEIEIVKSEIPVIPLQTEEGPTDINLDPLCPELHDDVVNLVNQFPQILTDMPLSTNLIECPLETCNDKPIRAKQYPLPLATRGDVKKEIDEMLKMKVIRPSSSPYSCPILLVKKKDGKLRFCSDLRALNKVVVFDSEPLPDIDSIFSKLSKAKFLSKIDLSKGYWQVPMKESDCHKTAFSTPFGHFEWVVMPFGLKIAGAIFSRLMRKVLLPLQRDDIDNFMDDIIVASDTWSQHLEALQVLFSRLAEVNISARPSKCFLGFSQLEFLGHCVGSGKVWPVDEKVEKILSAERPKTKKAVRSFIGLASYYRKFCPHFAEIALPLTNLTKGKMPNNVVWSQECENAFVNLKKRLSSKPICVLADPELPFTLRTDASDVGLGAVLLQDHGLGLQPVAYASKKLTDTERAYATIEKEAYAILWGVNRFHLYLYGRQFTLQTDHKPLQYLEKVKSTNGRLTRWAIQLQSFRYVIEAIPGSENVGADYLSRL